MDQNCINPGQLQTRMLAWYDRHRRDLPWRAEPGETGDPYRIWLSEIMLQQTTVVMVGPYFADFVAKWPRVSDLAQADLDDVLKAWAGLGYYARARNLHKCAQKVVEQYGGVFPASEAALLTLPGIGPYTAAAVAAIAFDLPASPVDGNIERVVSRLHALTDPLPDVKPAVQAAANALTPALRPGDFAQALMDLGAMICTPRKPACALCPWRESCRAAALGIAEELPKKKPKKQKPTRHAHILWLTRPGDGAIFIQRRAEKGLLGGLYEFPSSTWTEAILPEAEAKKQLSPPDASGLVSLPGVIRHTFTHFHLELAVIAGFSEVGLNNTGLWCPLDKLADYALPTVMKKVARHALTHADDL